MNILSPYDGETQSIASSIEVPVYNRVELLERYQVNLWDTLSTFCILIISWYRSLYRNIRYFLIRCCWSWKTCFTCWGFIMSWLWNKIEILRRISLSASSKLWRKDRRYRLWILNSNTNWRNISKRKRWTPFGVEIHTV